MKGRFPRRNPVTRAMRAELADDLTQLGRPITANERASCCPARPMVTVMMPPTASRPYPSTCCRAATTTGSARTPCPHPGPKAAADTCWEPFGHRQWTTYGGEPSAFWRATIVPILPGYRRAACRISDPRLGQIFDAHDHAEPPFIVTQWPYGTRLTGLLSDGPARPLPCGPRDRRGRWRAGRHARGRARAPRKDAMSCTDRWTAARQPGRAHAGGCLQRHRRCETGASASRPEPPPAAPARQP